MTEYVLINFNVLSHFNSLKGFKQSLVLSLPDIGM